MVWVSLIMAIVNLIIKLPDIIETIREILDRFKGVPPRAVAFEARKFLKACKEKEAAAGVVTTGAGCPIESFLKDLESRYSA